eukprot:scpid86562/ scgid16646/ Non-homologous end-joining factor 1; Protein cernunnos; XRCC4-like factor
MNPVTKWKVGLQSAPWRPLTVDGDSYLLKSVADDHGYHVAISDLVSIWFEQLDADAFHARSKEVNPKVEAPVTRLIRHVSSFIGTEPSKDAEFHFAKSSGEDESTQSVTLHLKTKLASLPYKWEFRLQQGNAGDVSEHVLCPLLLTAGELQRRTQELHQLLVKKDKEIAEYKSCGARITRRHLETSSFDAKVFDNEMLVSKNFTSLLESSPALCTESFSDVYKQVMMQHHRQHQQPDDVPDMDPLDEMMASYSQELPSSLVPGPSASSSYTYRLPASLVPSTVSGSDEPAAKRAFRSPPISPKKGTALTSPDKASPKKSPAKGKTSEAQSQEQELQRRLEIEERLKQQASKQKTKKKKIKL